MKAILIGTAISVAAIVLVLTPIAGPVYAGSAPRFADAKDDLSAAAAYCVAQGGEVETRAPYFNTNDDPKNWFRLSGFRKFCQFTLKKDGSRIHVLLRTLYTQQPSLAALAYYAKSRSMAATATVIQDHAIAPSWAAPICSEESI